MIADADLAQARAQTEIVDAQAAHSVEAAIREAFELAEVEGIGEILLLPRNLRPSSTRHKVFVMLASSDIDRDRRVVQLMCQFDGIDYDLVPSTARSMVPDAVTVIWRR